MIPEKMLDVLKHEGVVAIATQGKDFPHLVNTWNSYIRVYEDKYILYPAGGMHETEENTGRNNNVLLTVGSREVQGFNGPGTGFLIKGQAEFVTQGPEYDEIKKSFPWARAAVKILILSATQTL